VRLKKLAAKLPFNNNRLHVYKRREIQWPTIVPLCGKEPLDKDAHEIVIDPDPSAQTPKSEADANLINPPNLSKLSDQTLSDPQLHRQLRGMSVLHPPSLRVLLRQCRRR
jgi:hypothetical protein